MEQLAAPGYLPGKARFATADYAFSAFLLLLAGISWHRYAAGWDIYEKGILTAACSRQRGWDASGSPSGPSFSAYWA